MSSSWLSLYREEGEHSHTKEGPFTGFVTRGEALRIMEGGPRFDLIVFGGGLSGVAVAREAALEGAQVLLLESGYPGNYAMSWRESLVRGVLRSPWSLVRSSRALHDVATSLAPHLAKARRCDLSGCRGLGARLASRRLRTIASDIGEPGIVGDLPDIDERLLIRELALAARQEGVFVMGATTPSYVERDVESGTFRVGVRDLLSNEQVVVLGGGLFVDPTFSQPLSSRIGTPIAKLPRRTRPHVVVVCSVEGNGTPGLARYFELSGGAIGTLCEIQPGVLEVSLLDLPDPTDTDVVSSLVRQLCSESGYGFAREVSRRAGGSGYGTRVAVENRRGILIPHNPSPWMLMKVVQKTRGYIEGDSVSRRSRRPLPGEWRGSERTDFVEKARRAGIGESTLAAVIDRWRGRVRYIPEIERGFEEVCPGVLRGEISLAAVSDQVCSLEDLLFGSLALHTVPGWRELVVPLAAALAETGAVASEALNTERALAAMSAGGK